MRDTFGRTKNSSVGREKIYGNNSRGFSKWANITNRINNRRPKTSENYNMIGTMNLHKNFLDLNKIEKAARAKEMADKFNKVIAIALV